MGNTQTLGGSGGNTLKRHIETATKTGVLQYDNKKLKEVFENSTPIDRLAERFALFRSVQAFAFRTFERCR